MKYMSEKKSLVQEQGLEIKSSLTATKQLETTKEMAQKVIRQR
jgi:hypothetical protein